MNIFFKKHVHYLWKRLLKKEKTNQFSLFFCYNQDVLIYTTVDLSNTLSLIHYSWWRHKKITKQSFLSFFKESRRFDLHRRGFLKLPRKSDHRPEAPDPRGRRPNRVHVRGFHQESATYTGNRRAKIKLMV